MKRLFKKLVSVFLIVLMLFGSIVTTPVVFAQDNTAVNLITNGSFEMPYYTNIATWTKVAQSKVPGWSTTEVNGNIEYGFNNSKYGLPTACTLMPDGTQYNEVSCQSDSTLFQIISTQASTTYELGLSHHGRSTVPDTLLATMFDASKLTITKTNDMINLRQRMKDTAQDGLFEAPESGKAANYTVYTNSTLSSFSMTESDDCNVKITIWLISSDNKGWYNYGTNSSLYNYDPSPTINGQATGLGSVTEFTFEYETESTETSTCLSISTYITQNTNKDGTTNYSAGNVIDNVHLEEKGTRKVESTSSQFINTTNIEAGGEILTSVAVETKENQLMNGVSPLPVIQPKPKQ